MARLPFSLEVLLESLLRTEDGQVVTPEDIEALAHWDPAGPSSIEIAFTPSRVLMQDFTGVPAIVDPAAMRDAMEDLGGDPRPINPLVPVELVIDHSIQVDVFGEPRRVPAQRRAGARSATRARRLPALGPGGVRLFRRRRRRTPASATRSTWSTSRTWSRAATARCSRTRSWAQTSHTTMVNGLGVLGWGVGGIEAQAAMLGQPSRGLIPEVVGFGPRARCRRTRRRPTSSDRRHADAAPAPRRGQVRQFYGPGLTEPPARRPGDDPQHVA